MKECPHELVARSTLLEARATSSGPDRACRYRWRHGGRTVEIAVSDTGGSGPAWLLLPALSTISSRGEWQPFIAAAERLLPGSPPPRLMAIDWPGFGESDRLRMPYSAPLLARCLADVRRDLCPADCGVIAAGHAAGIALLAAERHGLAFRDWILVAPTWRGPFPTMAGRRSRALPLLRRLVSAPLLGSLLYRLNTTRGVLGWMSRRHVDLAGPGLTPAGRTPARRAFRQCRVRHGLPRPLRRSAGLAGFSAQPAAAAHGCDRRSVATEITGPDAGAGGCRRSGCAPAGAPGGA